MQSAPRSGLLGRLSGVQGLAFAAPLIVAGLGAWFAYGQGQRSAGVNAPEIARERRELTAKVVRLEAENARLHGKVAELEMARRLDRDAYGQVEHTLGDLQAKLSRQGDDLAFYRSIVSPADGVQGLRIQRFEVVPGTEPREYVLKLTLIQAMRHDSLAAGLADLIVHGTEGDRPAKHSVGELLGRPRAKLPFSFRYFQTVEQAVTLPAGFEPFEAEIVVRSAKLRTPIQQNFPWKTGVQVTL